MRDKQYGHGLVGNNAAKAPKGSKKETRTPANLQSFVKAIAASVAGDVQVQLFACNAARDAYGNAAWGAKGDVDGETSFAQDLVDELGKEGKDASVFAHTTAGHLRANYAQRIFGKASADHELRAGKSKGGVQTFDYIFTNAALDAETERIYGTNDKAKRGKVSGLAWRYYKNLVSEYNLSFKEPDPKKDKPIAPDPKSATYAAEQAQYEVAMAAYEKKLAAYQKGRAEYHGRLQDEGITMGLGDLAFIDPARARDEVVPHDFAQWVSAHAAEFEAAGELSDAAKKGTPRLAAKHEPKPVVIIPKTKTEPEAPKAKTKDEPQKDLQNEPKPEPKVEPQKDQKKEEPKPEPTIDPKPKTPTHVEREDALEQSHASPLDPNRGKSAEQIAGKQAFDADVKAYRSELGSDAPAERRARPLDALDALTSAQQAERHAADEAAVVHDYVDPLDQKKLVIGREKKKAALVERLTHLGLMGAEAKPVTLAPEERALIVDKVDRLANQLYFVGGEEDLDEAALDAMTVDLAQRMLSGRLAQRFLGDLSAYWKHFDRDKLAAKDKKALRQSDPAAFAAYQQDRELTKDVKAKHSGVAELGRDVADLLGMKTKDPGASPDDVRALVAAGQSAAHLEPHITGQVARPASEADPLVGGLTVSKRVDQVRSRAELDGALQVPLTRLGLGALPLTPLEAPAPDVRGADEQVSAQNLDAAEPAPPELKPSAFLTIVYKRLAELVLGIHQKPSAASPRLDDVRPGDRVPVTDTRQQADGHVWAQALVEPSAAVADAVKTPGPRLGWIDTAFTNETRGGEALEAKPQQGLTGEVPRGLTVIDYLRPVAPGQAIPCFAGVYPEDRALPVATIGADLLELVPQTADNAAELVEVLVQDRPLYAERKALRKAERAEKLLRLTTLSVGEIAEVRRFASCEPDARVRAAIFERLQAQPMFVAAQEGTSPDAAQHGPLAALGMALEVLGLPIPYTNAHSYSDALEMVRLEKGLPPALTGGALGQLIVPFGVSARQTDLGGVKIALQSGASVLLVQGTSVLRLAARADVGGTEQWQADDPVAGKRVTLDASQIAVCQAWALSVPTSYDDGSATKADPGLRDDQAVTDAYHQKVYGGTDKEQQAWYLQQAQGEHGEVAKQLATWLPSGGEAATMPPAAQRKAFDAWLARGKSLEHLGAVMRDFVTPLGAAGAEVTQMRADIQRRVRAIVRPLLAQRASVAAHEKALALIAQIESLGLLDAAELAALREEAKKLEPVPETKEPTDADFAPLADGPEFGAGTKGHAVPSPVATLGIDTSKAQIGEVRYSPNKPTWTIGEQRATVTINNVEVTFKYTCMPVTKNGEANQNRGLVGWVTDKITINGASVRQSKDLDRTKRGATYLSTEDLAAIGMTPDEIARYEAVIFGESTSHGNMTINAWDSAYVSIGAQGLIGHNHLYGSNVMANTIGPVLMQPECADLRALLNAVDVEIVHFKGDNYGFRAKAKGEKGAWYDNNSSYGKADVNAVYAAYGMAEAPRYDASIDDAKANQERFENYAIGLHPKVHEDGKHKGEHKQIEGNNMAQLVMRLDPAKLAVLSALGSDPRMQAAFAAQNKQACIEAEKASIADGWKSAYDYLWTPRGRAYFATMKNSGGNKMARDALIKGAEANQKEDGELKSPSAWTTPIEQAVIKEMVKHAQKGQGETFESYFKRHSDAEIHKLSDVRPDKKPAGTPPVMSPADIAKTFKPKGASVALEQKPKPEATPEEKVAPIDINHYVALTTDAKLKARLDAVHASPAGKRNLDAFTAPIVARMSSTAALYLASALGQPSWTDRVVFLMYAASDAKDWVAVRELARAVDCAQAVAAKYPELGEPQVDPKADPKKDTGDKGEGEPRPAIEDLKQTYNDPTLRFPAANTTLHVERDGQMSATRYMCGKFVPYRPGATKDGYQEVESLFHVGNIGDSYPKGTRFWVKANAFASWQTAEKVRKDRIVGDVDTEAAYMQEVGGGKVASTLWDLLRDSGDEDGHWGPTRGYVRDQSTYCNHLVIDAFDDLTDAKFDRDTNTNGLFARYLDAPPKDFKRLATSTGDVLDLYSEIWAEHVNKGELVFLLTKGDLNKKGKRGSGHILIPVPTKSTGSRTLSKGSITFGNVIQAGNSMGYSSLTSTYGSESIAAKFRGGEAQVFVYQGAIKEPSLARTTIDGTEDKKDEPKKDPTKNEVKKDEPKKDPKLLSPLDLYRHLKAIYIERFEASKYHPLETEVQRVMVETPALQSALQSCFTSGLWLLAQPVLFAAAKQVGYEHLAKWATALPALSVMRRAFILEALAREEDVQALPAAAVFHNLLDKITEVMNARLDPHGTKTDPQKTEPEPGGQPRYDDSATYRVKSDAAVEDKNGKGRGVKLAKGTLLKTIRIRAETTLNAVTDRRKSGSARALVRTVGEPAKKVTEADDWWIDPTALEITADIAKAPLEGVTGAASTLPESIRAQLPTNRRKDGSPYSFGFKSGATFKDGEKEISGTLVKKITQLAQWVLANDMTAGDIRVSDGARSAVRAHGWSLGYQLSKSKSATMDNLMDRVVGEEGKKDVTDLDGHRLWRAEWGIDPTSDKGLLDAKEKVREHAKGMYPGNPAAEGYPKDETKRRWPNPPKLNMSKHCSGLAVDVTIKWRLPGVDAQKDTRYDEWGWENIIQHFGMRRGAKDEAWHLVLKDGPPEPDSVPEKKAS